MGGLPHLRTTQSFPFNRSSEQMMDDRPKKTMEVDLNLGYIILNFFSWSAFCVYRRIFFSLYPLYNNLKTNNSNGRNSAVDKWPARGMRVLRAPLSKLAEYECARDGAVHMLWRGFPLTHCTATANICVCRHRRERRVKWAAGMLKKMTVWNFGWSYQLVLRDLTYAIFTILQFCREQCKIKYLNLQLSSSR